MHNCCVDWASRIVKYNVNKGSIACKSLLSEGDCDCRVSIYLLLHVDCQCKMFHLSYLFQCQRHLRVLVLSLSSSTERPAGRGLVK